MCWLLLSSAAVNTGVHVSFQIRVFVFSGYVPRSGLLDHTATPSLVFKKPPYCAQYWLHQFISPQTVQEVFFFSVPS